MATSLKARAPNGVFALADFDRDAIGDLVFIKSRNTGSGTVEVHVLSSTSNYQTFIVQTRRH
jgi:hypothetical protein